MKTISILIPVFRNEGTIKFVYEKLINLFENNLDRYNYEIVFVDDGSDDNSFPEILKLHDSDKKVKAIQFSRNFGQIAAIIAGLKEVGGDAVVIISADLQDPPEIISNMVEEWEKSNEIVVCHRIEREDNFIANVTSHIFYSLIKALNPKMPKGGFDFMLFDKKITAVLNTIEERNRFFQGDILWLGFSIKFIPYKRLKRTIGKSQWTIKKKVKYFIDGLLNTSYIPIRLMSFIGILTSFFGFIYALVVVYAKFINDTPFKGYAPIVILILIIGGLIMLMLGIIGEYVWRTYDETRKRPYYIIKNKYSNLSN